MPLAQSAPWVFHTDKGIFSSPVVGGDGTIYIGSADRNFYALDPMTGEPKWSHPTGEIIDSSALLDDAGRVIFGSGDGVLYALDATTGDELWTFEADDPAVNLAFINWFEGNVAIGPDGTLLVPNDNFFIYAIDREDGEVRWRFRVRDQTWSLPAIDPDTGNIYIGNNNLLSMLGANTFAIDPEGDEIWSASSDGTIAASPLLTTEPRPMMLLGGFDGFLRAYDPADGTPLWDFGARDHIYASPSQLSDGAIVQAAADGTVYALEPEDGTVRWAFDTGDAIRSSPAIDGDDNVYVGAGDGRLYVINADGTPRWSMKLVEGDRNDLNSSPAIGFEALYIASESGDVFSVPLDWCLRPEAMDDARCDAAPEEALQQDGNYLLYTTRFGSPVESAPETIDANQILSFTLVVREDGDTRLSLIDAESLEVTVDPPADVDVQVSGGRRFIAVRPLTGFTPGPLQVTINGRFLVDPDRTGLLFEGGTPGGDFSRAFDFEVNGPEAAGPILPTPVPAEIGDPAGIWELYRLAAPLPTILPSYNQIGFDSLHFLVGTVEQGDGFVVGWVFGGLLDEAGNTVPDPATRTVFPVEITWDGGLIGFTNMDGLALEAMNARLSFDTFFVRSRIAGDGSGDSDADVLATITCAEFPFYGQFLQQLGFCNPQTDQFVARGAILARTHEGGTHMMPEGVGTVGFEAAADAITATIEGSTLVAADYSVGILLVDSSDGRPVSLDYGPATEKTAAEDGTLTGVTLEILDRAQVPDTVRAYVVVNAYPVGMTELEIPAAAE